MDNILDVPAHFYENKLRSIKIYDMAISQMEGINLVATKPTILN